MQHYQDIGIDEGEEVRFTFNNKNGGTIIGIKFILNFNNWSEELKDILELIEWVEIDKDTCNLKLINNDEYDEDNYCFIK